MRPRTHRQQTQILLRAEHTAPLTPTGLQRLPEYLAVDVKEQCLEEVCVYGVTAKDEFFHRLIKEVDEKPRDRTIGRWQDLLVRSEIRAVSRAIEN